ncbi:hypothetical protein DYH09_12725 [bacterium CPR1]|nr:hypothetical protein [bacterium CPR1]
MRRGLALPTVLGVVSVLLTLGLALCTLSTVSLNLARRNNLEARAQLLARSGMAQLMADLRRIEADLPMPPSIPTVDLVARYPDNEIVPGCRIGFLPGLAYKSTDNLYSEFPQAGYLDRGSSARSVPPFTLELILHVQVQGARRDFRALVRRVWPYAAYVESGPLVLCGWLDEELAPGLEVAPSRVEGSVFVGRPWPGNMFGNRPDDDADGPRLWATRREFVRCQVTRVPGTITLGPALNRNGAFNPYSNVTRRQITTLSHRPSYWYTMSGGEREPLPVPLGEEGADVRNHLDGQVVILGDQAPGPGAVYVAPGNQFDGTVSCQRFQVDPLDILRRMIRPTGGTAVPGIPVLRPSLEDLMAPQEDHRLTFMLGNELTLTGETTRRWEVNGNLVNRVLWTDGDTDRGQLIAEAYPASITLRDCALHVKGDLDLWRPLAQDPTYAHFPPTVLSGTNATLIVDGTLTLAGGRLDSHDQGMVIYARHLVMRAGGNFKGLIVADRSACFLPDGASTLNVQGAILTGGRPGAEGIPGMVLRSVNLRYDPRYLKTLHSVGSFRLTGWQQL